VRGTRAGLGHGCAAGGCIEGSWVCMAAVVAPRNFSCLSVGVMQQQQYRRKLAVWYGVCGDGRASVHQALAQKRAGSKGTREALHLSGRVQLGHE
jgi:hypothetical protein